MRKHRGLIVVSAFILAMSMSSTGLVACGLSGQQGQEMSSAEQQQSTDDQFMQALSSGLQARWSIVDSTQSTDETLTKDQWTEATQNEYNAVQPFEDAAFENEKLGKAAKQYIEAMKDAVDACRYYDNDAKFAQKYTNSAYPRRVSAIYQINNIVKIQVPEDKQSNLDELLINGESYDAADKIGAKTKFKKQKDEYPGSTYHEYAAVVKNDSKVDYDWFQFDISLVDKKGVTVETTTASTDNWKAGTKHRFEFSTDKKFKKIELENYQFSLS